MGGRAHLEDHVRAQGREPLPSFAGQRLPGVPPHPGGAGREQRTVGQPKAGRGVEGVAEPGEPVPLPPLSEDLAAAPAAFAARWGHDQPPGCGAPGAGAGGAGLRSRGANVFFLFGVWPYDRMASTALLTLISARYERGSIILTCNNGFAEWGEEGGDPVIATAILAD